MNRFAFSMFFVFFFVSGHALADEFTKAEKAKIRELALMSKVLNSESLTKPVKIEISLYHAPKNDISSCRPLRHRCAVLLFLEDSGAAVKHLFVGYSIFVDLTKSVIIVIPPKPKITPPQ